MRRTIKVFLLVLSAAAAFAQTPIDALVTMDNVSPSSPGAAITPTIMSNGTLGSINSWSITGSASSLTVGAHRSLCTVNTPISIAGASYNTQLPTQSIALNNASSFTYLDVDLPGSSTKTSAAACITFGGVPNTTNLMDMLGLYGSTGGFVILQLRNGSCINIETDGSGTLHSGCITPSGTAPTYWCSLQANAVTGVASLACFQPSYPYTQVGSTVTVTQKSGASWGRTSHSRIGNAEIGTVSATTYFENVMYDYTSGVFPLGVGTLSSPPPTSGPWGPVLSSSRAIDWSGAGVAGGIPNRTTICSTLNPGATAASITAAIASCSTSGGGVVFLNAGTYNLSTGIDFNGSNNVTLRGAGANQTFLVFSGGGTSCHNHYSNVCLGQTNNETNWQGGPSNQSNWTAGYSQGSTVITLASVPNLKVGNPLILDQADDTADTGGIFVCSDNSLSPPCSLEDNNNNAQRSHRNQSQIVTVVDCRTDHSTTVGAACNTTSVTISPGIYMSNWTSTKSPQAWWATTPLRSSGVENMSLDHTNSSGAWGTVLYNCQNCWVKGIRSIDSGKAHVGVTYSNRATVRDSYFYATQSSGTQSYGVATYNSADSLFENNIMHYVEGPIMMNSNCDGCVAAYNYGINDYYTPSAGWLSAGIKQHTAGTAFILHEGNVMSAVYADVFHGTHNLITFFRNYIVGNQPVCSNGSGGFRACIGPLIPFDILSYSRYYNIVGNVLGQSGVHNGYQSGSKPIYAVGSGNTNGSVTVPADPRTVSTLLRWGNYDVVTGAVRWCGNSSNTGWSTTCSSTSEIPTGLAQLANSVPATQTLPASFYLAAKPSWWPTAKAWPPIGPDVSGGNISGLAGHAFTIPAQDCYANIMGGPADGTGPVRAFDPTTCYGQQVGPIQPAPPSGLSAVVY